MAPTAVSKEASDNQLSSPVCPPKCVLHSWTHSCRRTLSACIHLAGIKSQASGKDGEARGQSSMLEDRLGLDLSQPFYRPLASNDQRTKKNKIYPSWPLDPYVLTAYSRPLFMFSVAA